MLAYNGFKVYQTIILGLPGRLEVKDDSQGYWPFQVKQFLVIYSC